MEAFLIPCPAIDYELILGIIHEGRHFFNPFV